MAHSPKPYFKSARCTWYVEVDRVQHALGKHPAGQPEPRKGKNGWDAPAEIRQAFHAKMSELSRIPDNSDAPAPQQEGHPHVACVLDDFIGWLAKRVEEGSKERRTLEWYSDYLVSFLDHLRTLETPRPAVPTLTVDELRPSHLYSWVDSQADWKTGRRGAIVAVQRALNWANKAGKLKSLGGKSPLAGMEKPQQGRRELVVTPEEFDAVLAAAGDRNFRDLLVAAWETGARPNELFTVEGSYFDDKGARWVFPIRRSKGKRVQRVVYLTDKALEVTRRLAAKHPSGPLLRTTEGTAWCVSSVKCRFQNMRVTLGRKKIEALGIVPPPLKRLTAAQRADPPLRAEHQRKVLARRKAIKALSRDHGTRYNLYAIRHSYITEALVRGIDAVTVSVLAGHRDTTMISRHYSHLTERHDYLTIAAKKARPENGGAKG